MLFNSAKSPLDFLDTKTTTKTNHPFSLDPRGLLPPGPCSQLPPAKGSDTLNPGMAVAPNRAAGPAGPAGPSPPRSLPPRLPGRGPKPAGLTLSWSHRTLLRFSSGARFRSRPINSSNNCAAEIMVLSSGGCSHQPWHQPKTTPATPSLTSSVRSQAKKASSEKEPIRQNGRRAGAFPACRARACALGDTPKPGRRGRAASAGLGAGPAEARPGFRCLPVAHGNWARMFPQGQSSRALSR